MPSTTLDKATDSVTSPTYVKDNFVVYAYARSRDSKYGQKGVFYYIGKGRPHRPYSHYRRIKRPCDKKYIHVLHTNLSNKTAIQYKKSLISFYGRIDKHPSWGVLRNMTNGGEGTAGRVVTDSHREKVSGDGQPGYRPLNWFHSVCGELYGKSIADLARMFPEQNLKKGALCRVASGAYLQHRGWRVICCQIDGSISTKKRTKSPKRYRPLNFFHPVCGEILNKTAPELVSIFPEQNLNATNLYQVSKGILAQHQGWRPVCCPIDKDISLSKIARAYRPLNWFHPVCGEIFNTTIPELIEMFPDQLLEQSALWRISKGTRYQYKGWRPICCTI
jgi:hypothetical protein